MSCCGFKFMVMNNRLFASYESLNCSVNHMMRLLIQRKAKREDSAYSDFLQLTRIVNKSVICQQKFQSI